MTAFDSRKEYSNMFNVLIAQNSAHISTSFRDQNIVS